MRIRADGRDLHQLAQAAGGGGLGKLVQVSAIGADAHSKAKYARSKAQGEAAVRQGQHRRQGRQPAEAVEEVVVLAEHHRRAHDHRGGHDLPDRGFALRLAAGVLGLGVRIRADGRDLHQLAQAAGGGGLGDHAGALGVQALEALAAMLVEHAHQVDAGVGPHQGAVHRGRDPQIGLHHLDLPDIAEQPGLVGQVGAAAGDADAQAPLGKGADDLPANEAGAAEDCHQSLHCSAFRCWSAPVG